MNLNIVNTRKKVMNLYFARKKSLEFFTDEQLRDLLHACDEVAVDADYSLRVAAEINRVAAEMTMEERK